MPSIQGEQPPETTKPSLKEQLEKLKKEHQYSKDGKSIEVEVLAFSRPQKPKIQSRHSLALSDEDRASEAGRTRTLYGFFSAEGRIGRLTYLLTGWGLGFILPVIIGVAVLSVSESTGVSEAAAAVVGSIAIFIGLAIRICAMIKRFHDLDKSGNWVWLYLIPVIGLLLELMLLFMAGSKGPNQFGPES
jgi:uncharacterized membrane protein YhaH (DUF805 family)